MLKTSNQNQIESYQTRVFELGDKLKKVFPFMTFQWEEEAHLWLLNQKKDLIQFYRLFGKTEGNIVILGSAIDRHHLRDLLNEPEIVINNDFSWIGFTLD